jgi:aspartyl-tRNA(Asn)/glutamyl-tRNA(Gln) amidotransferase subunit B
MRTKEEANDYRYFPDPDLLPVVLDDAYIEAVRKELPELPDVKKHRFMDSYGLSAYDAGILISSRELAEYYEEAVKTSGGDAKLAANWVNGEVAAMLNKNNIEITESPVSAKQLGTMLKRIEDGTISGKAAKTVFEAMWNGEGDADQIIKDKDLVQIKDTGLIEKAIEEVIANNPKQLEQYRNGEEKLLKYFVGQVMKATKGKADPKEVNELMREKLK